MIDDNFKIFFINCFEFFNLRATNYVKANYFNKLYTVNKIFKFQKYYNF